MGNSGLASVLAGENAAMERTAPSEADIAAEMWRSGFTSYSTRLVRFAPRSLTGFLQSRDRLVGGYPNWHGLPLFLCQLPMGEKARTQVRMGDKT
jgi:hypothetical protein